MTELVPGTPEYQEAYDKEIKRLETEAKPEAEITSPEEPIVEIKTETKEPKDDKSETLEEIKARLDSTEKALKDTQRWGHQNAVKVAKLEKERLAEKHNANRPKILDENPGLEDAIKHVSTPQQEPQQVWLETVGNAISDIEQLLGDKEFHDKASAIKNELGDEWNNPIVAIRELSDLKVEHLRNKAVQGAVEKARKDFEAKSKKRVGMEVPGGGGGSSQVKSEDEVKKVWDMDDNSFQKMRAKVLGYS